MIDGVTEAELQILACRTLLINGNFFPEVIK